MKTIIAVLGGVMFGYGLGDYLANKWDPDAQREIHEDERIMATGIIICLCSWVFVPMLL